MPFRRTRHRRAVLRRRRLTSIGLKVVLPAAILLSAVLACSEGTVVHDDLTSQSLASSAERVKIVEGGGQ